MTHSIHIPVWDTHCHVLLWPKNLRGALKRLKVPPKDIDDVEKEDCTAITFDNDKGEAVILVKHPMPRAELIGTLAHEAFHAADHLLADRDVFLRRGDHNEPHAYLIGYIVEEMAKRLSLTKHPTRDKVES